MASWAKPGGKCVKFRTYTPPQFRHIRFRPPRVRIPIGDPVTIAGTTIDPVTGLLALLIEGYPNTNDAGRDCGWWIGNFRPLVTKTKEEDVAMFKRIANDVPLKEMIEAGLYPIH